MSGFNLYRHMQEHGRNTEAIRAQEAKIKALEQEVGRNKQAIDQAKGGWRALLLVGSIAGTLGAIITRVFFH